VAGNGSQSAAPFILESGKGVIAMGGFAGTDPAPTLSEFKHLVAMGEVHYVYVSGGAGSSSATGVGPGGAGGTAPSGIRTAVSTKSAASANTAEATKARAGRPGGGGGTSGGFSGAGAVGGQTSTASAVDTWVEKYGTKVSSSAYGGSSSGGTLYYVSSSTASK
jgi:hypothetical protein